MSDYQLPVYTNTKPNIPITLSVDLPCFCFHALVRYLRNLTPPDTNHLPIDQIPLFVTWTTLDGRLRGCLGTFKPGMFRDELAYYAVASAVCDKRFLPISLNEIKDLVCHVSVLGSFEPCTSYLNWEIGIHGVIIEFESNGKNFHGTFLPEVAIERSWDHRTTMVYLIKKTGYSGNIDQNLLDRLKVTRYQSYKVSADYRSYQKSSYFNSM